MDQAMHSAHRGKRYTGRDKSSQPLDFISFWGHLSHLENLNLQVNGFAFSSLNTLYYVAMYVSAKIWPIQHLFMNGEKLSIVSIVDS